MRLLTIALCVTVTYALHCPDSCDCGTGDELEFYCSVASATVIFNARNNEYVNIKCEGTNFTCADLPVLNLANNQPLPSLTIKGCSPSILLCINEVLKTPSVSFLNVYDGVAPLEGQYVANLGDVRDVMISRGREKTIPISVVHALPSLRRLRITGTQVTLESNVFTNSTQLEFLELADGLFGTIPEDAFNGLSNLQILNMWGNNIKEIGVNSFRGLDSLQKLDLTTSHISSMAAGALAHVPQLKTISLFMNELKELPYGLMYNLTQLENITIQSNNAPLQLHKHSFANLPSLKNLIIEDSSANLPEDLLTGSDELVTISLSGNEITSLPNAIFKDLKNLERLDLSRNKISKLDSGVFSPLKKLQYLNLNRNYLVELPDFLFAGLRNLNYVSMDDNLIEDISSLTFQGAIGLRTVSLKSNRLTLASKEVFTDYFNLGDYSPFNMLVNLKNLYLNGNQISNMFSDWRMVLTRLEELDLSGNNFTTLDIIDCQFLSNNLVVDLRRNNISNLMLNFDTLSDEPYTEPTNSILLDENPFTCDCYLFNLAMRLRGKIKISGEPKFVVGNAKCSSPESLKGQFIENVSLEDLNCALPAENCFETCSSCEIRPATATLAYDCKTIPLNMSKPENFQLKSLSLRLRTPPTTINNLNLQLLNLSNLGLEEIPFPPSKSVKEIDFSNNRLTEIPMQFLESNTTLYLSNNRFTCDCWHSRKLLALKSSKIVKDINLINCGDKLLVSINPEDLCSNWQAASIAGGTFLILVIIVAIIGIIIYKNSHEILIFVINKGICPCFFIDDPDDIDKEYDVFVSYAHKDKQFLEKLMPTLENIFGLKTCVHYRDWFVGDFIPDQINRSVEKSRKTIILLSNNFLDSAYANMEFRAAHNLALKEGKNRIILILLEDVTKHEKLSEELKAHMKMNTFLKWDDPRFHERLQRAVPLRNNKKFVWPEVFKQAGEKSVNSGLDVHLNSEGKLVNVAMKDAV